MLTDYLNPWAEFIYSALASAAILAGGYWTWRLFVRQRQKYPCANISHDVTHRNMPCNKTLLRVHVAITNASRILLPLEKGFTRLQQILPLEEEDMQQLLLGEGNLLKQGDTEVRWPLIDDKEFSFEKEKCELEPGESEEIHCDFFIDSSIQTVLIYSYLENPKKKEALGWSCTTVYDLSSPSNQLEKE